MAALDGRPPATVRGYAGRLTDALLAAVNGRVRAVYVHGSAATEVIGPVDQARLLEGMARELAWGLDRAPAHYALLNACRALAYLHHGRLVGKTTAGRWAIGQNIAPSAGVSGALATQTGAASAAILTDADTEFIRQVAGRLVAAAR